VPVAQSISILKYKLRQSDVKPALISR